MELNEIDAVIFDFGGVLINLDYERTVSAFKSLGIDSFEELYSKASQTNVFDDFETGQISAQRFINDLLRYLPQRTTPNQVVHAWNAMILDVPKEVIELLAKLKRTKKIYLLSNTNEIHIDLAFRRWMQIASIHPKEVFDNVFLSHEIHLRKPHIETFEFVLEFERLIPERSLFIDDSIQHIEGAQKTGMKTHHLLAQEDLYAIFS